MKKNRLVVYTKNAYVNYNYVKDVTALIMQLISDNASHGIINVGRSMELEVFYKLLKKFLDSKSLVLRLPELIPAFIGALGLHSLDAVSSGVQYSDSKLAAFFSYPYGLEQGLARTIKFYEHEKLL